METSTKVMVGGGLAAVTAFVLWRFWPRNKAVPSSPEPDYYPEPDYAPDMDATVPPPPTKSALFVSKTRDRYDPCAGITCPVNHYCWNGQCMPIE